MADDPRGKARFPIAPKFPILIVYIGTAERIAARREHA
jgi:hypothetical protein